jgi:FAD/FMN-containing dehydrogenase
MSKTDLQHWQGLEAGARLQPQTAADVATILAGCRARGLSVVPIGGQTGLVGGTVVGPDQIGVSLAAMNRIERLDPVERVAVVGAGVTLQALQEAAAELGLEPGIDLAARGSATIGGMVATNAGGVMAFRNGVMRHRVLGIEAVLPDGTIYSDLTRVVKNAAGYDLKHLFIGAEGTLGVVTKVALRLDVAPIATLTAVFALPDVAAALQVVDMALRLDAGQLRAAEAMWADYIRLTAVSQGWQDASFPLDQPIYLLLSLGGADAEALAQGFERLFEDILARYPAANGIIAQSTAQDRALWLLREDSWAIYRTHPDAPSYDISVPLSALETYVCRVEQGLRAIDPQMRPYIFGHLADGNLHIVLNCEGPLEAGLEAAIDACLYNGLRELGGSFSAEHGVGSKRIQALLATADAGKIAAMGLVKCALDPVGLMNPGTVLPLSMTTGRKAFETPDQTGKRQG